MWCPHSVDRSANSSNAQLERFNSRYWSPGSEAVDTFTCSQAGENNWWCPPVYLFPRVIRHAQIIHCEGTLVVPQWVSSPFWPLLFPDGVNPIESVVGIAELRSSEDLFLPVESGHNLFKDIPNTPVLALQLDFTKKALPM